MGESKKGFADSTPHLLRHVRNLPFPSVPPLVCPSFEPSLIGDEYDGVPCKTSLLVRTPGVVGGGVDILPHSPFAVQAAQPDRNSCIQPLPIVFSSWVGVTTLRPYQSLIQIKRGDLGMMDWRKVYAMEHSIFDALKETKCCRGFGEYCVCWVRMARLGADAGIGNRNIYFFLSRLSRL